MKHAIRIFNLIAPYVGVVLVYLLFYILGRDTHWHNWDNLQAILVQTVVVGVGALGMTLVIISGGIDLSVGSVLALGLVVPALVLRGPSGGYPFEMLAFFGIGSPAGGVVFVSFLAVLCCLLVCSGVGVFNGVVSAGFGIVPFIVTLGSMQIARGLAKWLAHNQPVYVDMDLVYGRGDDGAPLWLFQLMHREGDRWYQLPAAIWILVGLTLLTWFVLRFTVFGRYVYAIGSNASTARLCGINVTGYRILIYTLMGVFIGLAALLQYSELTTGDPTEGVALELDIIAAVVIGGGSLAGGEGSAIGSVLGALMMAMLRNGCTFVGVPDAIQDIVIGAVIVGAVGIDRLKHAEDPAAPLRWLYHLPSRLKERLRPSSA